MSECSTMIQFHACEYWADPIRSAPSIIRHNMLSCIISNVTDLSLSLSTIGISYGKCYMYCTYLFFIRLVYFCSRIFYACDNLLCCVIFLAWLCFALNSRLHEFATIWLLRCSFLLLSLDIISFWLSLSHSMHLAMRALIYEPESNKIFYGFVLVSKYFVTKMISKGLWRINIYTPRSTFIHLLVIEFVFKLNWVDKMNCLPHSTLAVLFASLLYFFL